MEKEAFWTFLERKSEEFDKVPKAAGKGRVTASSLPQTASGLDGPEHDFLDLHETASRRPSGNPSGGEVTASPPIT